MITLLIDPVSQTITEAEHDGSLDDIYRLLSWEDHKCGGIDAITLADTECLYVDDEGLLARPPLPLWEFTGYPQPLAGRGLLCGLDREGSSVSTGLSVAAIAPLVVWRPNMRCVGMRQQNDFVDHPILGRIPRFMTIPVFEEF